jgi:tetratricopeptide (TPR) repeat protein
LILVLRPGYYGLIAHLSTRIAPLHPGDRPRAGTQSVRCPRRTPRLRVVKALTLVAFSGSAPAAVPAGGDLLDHERRIRAVYAEAEDLMAHGRSEEARSRLASILDSDPQHPLAPLGLAMLHYRGGDLDSFEARLSALAGLREPARSYGLGVLRHLQGRDAEAVPLLDEALASYRSAGHAAGIAASLTALGNVRFRSSRVEAAREAYEEASAILERLGDERGLADIWGNLGNIAQRQGHDDSALDFYARSLRVREALGDRKGLATTYHNIGFIERRTQGSRVALGSFERALSIHRAIGDRPGMTRSLASIGLARLDLGDYEEAARSLRRALDLAREIGDRRTEADVLTNLATVDLRTGRLERGHARHLAALDLRRQAGDRAGEAASLNNVAAVLEMRGETPRALELYESSMALHGDLGDRRGAATAAVNVGRLRAESGRRSDAEALLRGAVQSFLDLQDARGEAGALEELGKVLMRTADVDGALRALERALALRRRLGDRPGEASCLGALGLLHARRAEFGPARASLDEALRLMRLLGSRGGEASILDHQANLSFQRGEFAEALRLIDRALELRRSIDDRRGAARSLGDLGAVHQAIGDRGSAERYFRRALDALRALPDRYAEALTLVNLGILLDEAGELEEAGRSHAAALRIFEATGDRRGAAFARLNLAETSLRRGLIDPAQAALDEALGIFGAFHDRLGEIRTLIALGDLRLTTGDAGRALSSYDEARRVATKHGMRDEVWQAEVGRGAALERLGRRAEALHGYERAMDGVDALRRGLVTDRFRTRFLAGKADLYARAVDALWEDGRGSADGSAAGRAFSYVERGRARALADLLAESHADIGSNVDPDLLRRERSVLDRIERIHGRLREAAGDDERDRLEVELDEAEEGLDLLTLDLRRGAPGYAALRYPDPATVAEVRARMLAPGEVLLAYSLGERRSYVWSVTRSGVRWTALPARSRIEEAARRFLDRVRTQAADLGRTPSWVDPARQLGRMLLPAGFLSGSRVLVVPDSLLHVVPFEGLLLDDPDRPGEARPLIETHAVSYVPSATVLGALRGRVAGRERGTPADLVLFGAPAPAVDPAGAAGLPPLPFAGEEVRRVAALFPERHRLVRTGGEATRSALLSLDLRETRFLHFATHAWVDEDIPGRSAIVLAPSPSGDDGLLRINDVFGLRLGADMVVLSGCLTGLGRIVRGEGMVGLSRAFFDAGARSLVVSLWRVSDRSAALLMERFYQGLVAGVDAAEALRRAKRSLIASEARTDRHPSRWAAFVLLGDAAAGLDAGGGPAGADGMNLSGHPTTEQSRSR